MASEPVEAALLPGGFLLSSSANMACGSPNNSLKILSFLLNSCDKTLSSLRRSTASSTEPTVVSSELKKLMMPVRIVLTVQLGHHVSGDGEWRGGSVQEVSKNRREVESANPPQVSITWMEIAN